MFPCFFLHFLSVYLSTAFCLLEEASQIQVQVRINDKEFLEEGVPSSKKQITNEYEEALPYGQASE